MNPVVAKKLISQRIHFKYNPPYAPHFGGVWEREIRSIKQGLQSILGADTVTEAVLRTVFAEVAILNSKLLGYVSSDVADIDPVTPNSFLIGRPDTALPQVVYPEDELLSRKRWRQSQVLADQFWNIYIRRYLPSLQIRDKWQKDVANSRVGDVVMIMDPNQIRAKWLIGKITAVYPGADDRVRSASVHVGADQDYIRPIAKLVTLSNIPD